MTDTTESDIDALAEYYHRLSEHPDAPLGEAPARELIARTAAAIAEHKAAANEIVTAVLGFAAHLAEENRRALELLARAQPQGAADVLNAQINAIEQSLLLGTPGGAA